MSRTPRLRSERFRLAVPLSLLAGSALLSACAAGTAASGQRATLQQVPGGDPERGRQAIVNYGCGACHTIPGVPGAGGRVAPQLNEWGTRTSILGLIPNTPERLMQWIAAPDSLRPGTTMPGLAVSEDDARQIAAYLYTLR